MAKKILSWIEVADEHSPPVVVIDGIRYDREFFHAFASWPAGTTFRLERKTPDSVGVVLVELGNSKAA